jgi:hypothetical protein
MQLRAGSPKASALIWRWRGTPAEAATGPSAASVRVRGTLQALGGAAFGGLSLAFWSKGVALVAFALSGLVLFSALVSPGGLYALLRRLFDATGRVIGRITTWIVMVPIFYLYEAARSVGAHFAVLLFPYPAQVVRDGRDPVEEQVLAIARRHAWTVVDPLATFRTANAAGTPLFLDLWHPTTEGHRIAAEATLQRLACTGELGPKARSVCGGGAGARAGG